MESLVKEGFSVGNHMGTNLSREESQSIGEKVLEIIVSLGQW